MCGKIQKNEKNMISQAAIESRMGWVSGVGGFDDLCERVNDATLFQVLPELFFL
jgi:hypothetical protein